jgi:DNA-binding NarL/FixJ family response regulator
MHTHILIADRLDMFREVLKQLLETEPDFTVVAQTGDGERLTRLVAEHKPDVLLFDLRLRKRSGIDALREIASDHPEVRPIALADAIAQNEIVQVLLWGARGLVRKNTPAPLLFKSIRTVMAGQYWISHDMVVELIDNLRLFATRVEQNRQRQARGLTSQQQQILTALVAGCSNKEIARELSLSERTVKYHLARVFKTFDVTGRMELARFSLENKLVREA